MTGFRVVKDWAKGSNNLAQKDRLPEGFVRNAVNLDPTVGGTLSSRVGYERIYAGTDVRGVLALGSKLLAADGVSLVEVDTTTGSSRVLRTIAGAGPFCGDVLNERLYFCTASECLVYDGQSVSLWGATDVTGQPAVVASVGGGLIEGYYRVAMTYTNADGLEGGTDKPLVMKVAAGEKLAIAVPAPPAGMTANIYVGSVHGDAVYWQFSSTVATSYVCERVRDDTKRCTTILLRAPQPGSKVVAHNGCLAIASENTIQVTRPMQAHLVDRVRGMIQYPAPVTDMVSAGALFVSADKCYALTNVETDGISQRTVLEYPAVAGTAVLLPDGRGAWMTRYGQAITDGENVNLVNRETFAVPEAEAGSSGVVDHNGNQLIVTSMRGKNTANPLVASDFYIGEIINP